MTNIQKFHTDVLKIVKNERNSDGSMNLEQCCSKIISFFERESSVPGNLAGAVGQYWKETYIDSSAEPENEPSSEKVDVLCGFLSFLENSDEYFDVISDNDWAELSELVNFEAEDLPIDILQQLMSTLVEQNAL